MARRDELAKRLAERLDKAPPKGRAMRAPTAGGDAAASGPARAGSKQSGSKRSASKQSGSKRTASKQTGSKRTASKPTSSTRVGSERAASKQPASTRGRGTLSGGSSNRSSDRPTRQRRGAPGTVLRGHLIPDSIHADARRRKAVLRSTVGDRVTWDDVFTAGVELLVGRAASLEPTLEEIRSADPAGQRRRFVQATLPAVLDQALVEIQLDLSEDPDRSATFEQLWTAALLLWLRATE